MRGMATPFALGPVGHMSAEKHNSGGNGSIFTSWTIFRTVANYHASKNAPFKGVVLKKTFKVSEIVPSPNGFGDEGEFLVPGIVKGAEVTLPNNSGNPTGY